MRQEADVAAGRCLGKERVLIGRSLHSLVGGFLPAGFLSINPLFFSCFLSESMKRAAPHRVVPNFPFSPSFVNRSCALACAPNTYVVVMMCSVLATAAAIIVTFMQ